MIPMLTGTTLGHQVLVLHTLTGGTLVQFTNFPPSTVFGGTGCTLPTTPSLCFFFQTSLERVQPSQDGSQKVHLLWQTLSALFLLIMVACHPSIFIHYILVLPNKSAIVKNSCGKTLLELANPVATENLKVWRRDSNFISSPVMAVGHKFYSQGWSNAPLLPDIGDHPLIMCFLVEGALVPAVHFIPLQQSSHSLAWGEQQPGRIFKIIGIPVLRKHTTSFQSLTPGHFLSWHPTLFSLFSALLLSMIKKM